MNLSDVLDELAGRVRPTPGLNSCLPYPPDRIVPPAGFLRLPDTIEFDQTYGRGMDAMDMFLLIVSGKVDAASAHRMLAKFANATGEHSVKARIEAPPAATAYDDAHVRSVDFAITDIAGVPLLAAVFTIRVVGNGA